MDALAQSLPFLLLIFAFVLLFVLPMRQRKKMAGRMTALQNSLQVGTQVMLSCGLYGTVSGLGEQTVDIEIAPGTVTTFARAAVLEITSPEQTQASGERTDGRAPEPETTTDS